MKQGAWINAHTFEFFWVQEHADWIKIKENAMKLGVPEATWEKIKNIPNDYGGNRREAILLMVMQSGPFIRMRGQGILYAFEFMCSSSVALCRETIDMPYHEFKEYMNEDESKILRLATTIPDKNLSRFASDLLNRH